MTTNLSGDDVRLVIHHEAKTGFLNFLGCAGLLSFSCAPFMLLSASSAHGGDLVNAVCGGLTGLLCIVLPVMAARAPRTVDLVLDRTTGQIEATVARLIGPIRRTIPMSAVAGVDTYYRWGPARVGVNLRLSDGEQFNVFDGASLGSVKAEADDFANRLADFIQVPHEGALKLAIRSRFSGRINRERHVP